MLVGNSNWKNDVKQNLQILLFYIPFGLSVPISRWKALALAYCFSVTIELVQYIGQFWFCEHNDIICNTIDAIIGIRLWVGLTKLKGKINAT